MSFLFTDGKFRAINDDGTPLVGGLLYTYISGTNTNKNTYQDSGLTTPNTNPVVLNSRGEASVWLATGAYTMTLKRPDTTTVWSQDGIEDPSDASTTLATNLASTTNASLGANLVGTIGTSTGEVGKNVGPYLNLLVKGLKKNFGAVGGGVTDDRTAIANALTTTGKTIEIEDDTFLFNSNLPVPTCSAIVGRGELVSILKPGAAVTTVLDLNGSGSYPRLFQDFIVDGSSTTGAVGAFAGDTNSEAASWRRVQMKNFTGTNAAGWKIDRLLKADFLGCTAYGNDTNLLVAGSGGGFPTTLLFMNFVSTNAVNNGIKITSCGGQIIFEGGDCDSCGVGTSQAGLLVKPASGGTAAWVKVDGMWFEGNNAASGYQIIIDGSAGGGATAGFVIPDAYFNNTAGSRKGMYVTGSGARVLYGNLTFATAQATNVLVDSGAVAKPMYWNAAMGFLSNVTDNSGLALGVEGAEAAWTPTYGQVGGTSFSSVTTNLARFKRMGSNLVKMDVNFSGTAVGSPTSLTVSLPNAGWTGISSSWGMPAKIISAGVASIGIVSSDGAGNLVFSPLTGSFSAGTCGGVCSVMLEITN